MRVAIIGAGLAGLTAARSLKETGLSPAVFDKGRGPGGRLSTRRTGDSLQFDHGAQYFSPEDPEFASFLLEIERAGAAGRWDPGGTGPKFVGIPGMSAVARHLAKGIDLRQGIEVPEITPDAKGWSIAGEVYDRVISAVPAPQAMRLLAGVPTIQEALNSVIMEPTLALMLAHPKRSDHPFTTRRRENEDIAWLALDSAKPGRSDVDCWVAHAGLDWSKTYLESEKDEIAARMVPLVCDLLELEPDALIHTAGHRWRYAYASTPLGRAYLEHSNTLFVGGDWALSARAEGAWQSGRSMAEALLRTC